MSPSDDFFENMLLSNGNGGNTWDKWYKLIINELGRLNKEVNKNKDDIVNLTVSNATIKQTYDALKTKLEEITKDIGDIQDQLTILSNTMTDLRLTVAQKITFGAGGGAIATVIIELMKYIGAHLQSVSKVP